MTDGFSEHACFNLGIRLQDILEIPELMETCVRSELYDEALQLEAFTLGLKKKHPDIPIIQCIAEDVGKSRELMLNQLHQKLRGTHIILRVGVNIPNLAFSSQIIWPCLDAYAQSVIYAE